MPLPSARSATSLPTALAAPTSAPVLRLARVSFSTDEAAASVSPFSSSMTWA
jgi:hypothetical protein